MIQLTEQEAIAFSKSEKLNTMSSFEIVKLQLYQDLLCMEFGKFHEAIENVLNRPVQTIEFGIGVDNLKKEFENICKLKKEKNDTKN